MRLKRKKPIKAKRKAQCGMEPSDMGKGLDRFERMTDGIVRMYGGKDGGLARGPWVGQVSS